MVGLFGTKIIQEFKMDIQLVNQKFKRTSCEKIRSKYFQKDSANGSILETLREKYLEFKLTSSTNYPDEGNDAIHLSSKNDL